MLGVLVSVIDCALDEDDDLSFLLIIYVDLWFPISDSQYVLSL